MNKKLKITLLSILSIIIALGAAWSGWMIGEKNSNQIKEKTEEKISQEMEVYFYRTDGIYKITSSDEKPQQIVKTTFDKEQHWSFTSQFEIMGEKNNWLVYRDKVGENPDVKQIELGLMVYDVNEQKEIMSVKEDNSSVTNFIISPEKKSIAYVLNSYDSSKSENQSPFYQELYVWSKDGGTKKILTEESGFFGLGLGMWLDEENLTIGRGYEGISYCSINIKTTKEMPKNCEGYGSSVMGVADSFKIFEDDVFYGFRYEWQEITGNKSTGGIFKKSMDGEREYLSSDITADLVVGEENIYYLRHNRNASKYVYNGVETDLYLVSKNGEYSKRLTNDGTSVLAKSNLFISSDKRFIGYQAVNRIGLSQDEGGIQTQQENSTIWIYDTQLNKYYQVAENGLAPKIILVDIN
jgi:hypothetical protein